MKKLIISSLIVLLSTPFAFGWTLKWDDPGDEDGFIIYHKLYPEGYSYPNNLAPADMIIGREGATKLTLPADTVQWEIPSNFVPGQRYVFFAQATKGGSVSGFSEYLCWTYPLAAKITELPQPDGSIEINIILPLR